MAFFHSPAVEIVYAHLGDIVRLGFQPFSPRIDGARLHLPHPQSFLNDWRLEDGPDAAC